MSEDIIGCLSDIKSGVTSLNGLIKLSAQQLTKDRIQPQVQQLNAWLEELLQLSGDAPEAVKLNQTTRRLMATTLLVIKTKHQNGSLDEVLDQLDAVNADFNQDLNDCVYTFSVNDLENTIAPVSGADDDAFLDDFINAYAPQTATTTTTKTQPRTQSNAKPSSASRPVSTAGGGMWGFDTTGGGNGGEENVGDDIGGSVIFVNDSQEYDQALKNAQTAVVNVSNLTPDCKKMEEIFQTYAENNSHTTFIYVDHGIFRPHPDFRSVTKLPTFRVYKQGKKVHEFAGADTAAFKKAMASYVVGKGAPPPEVQATQTRTAAPSKSQPQKTPQQNTQQKTQPAQTQPQVPTSVQALPATKTVVPKVLTGVGGNPGELYVSGTSFRIEGDKKDKVIYIESDSEYQSYLKNTAKITVVNISISNAPCIALFQVFKELSYENDHAQFLLCELNLLKSKIKEFQSIKEVPTFRFYKEGKLVQEISGAFNHGEAVLRDAVARHVKPARKGLPPKKGKQNLVPPGVVTRIDTEEMFQQLLAVEDVLLVVNFWNAANSPICEPMKEEFARQAAAFPDVMCVDVNHDVSKGIIRAASGVQRFPLFRFYKNYDKLDDCQIQPTNMAHLKHLLTKFTK